jgi:Skp family chaperone for outer membrane proteins
LDSKAQKEDTAVIGKAKKDDAIPMLSVSPQNVAVVPTRKIQSQYDKIKEATESVQKCIDPIQRELLSMVSDCEKVRKEYQELLEKAGNPALTEEAKKKVKAEADEKLGALKQKELAVLDFKTNSENRISKMIEEENVKNVIVIKQKIGEIAKAKGISVVVDGDNPVILFSADALDITEIVITVLNADQPKIIVTESPVKK